MKVIYKIIYIYIYIFIIIFIDCFHADDLINNKVSFDRSQFCNLRDVGNLAATTTTAMATIETNGCKLIQGAIIQARLSHAIVGLRAYVSCT